MTSNHGFSLVELHIRAKDTVIDRAEITISAPMHVAFSDVRLTDHVRN